MNVSSQRTRISQREAGADEKIRTLLTSGDRRNDTDFVTFFDGRVLVVEKSNVLVVEENVDEATNVALFITNALGEAGIRLLEADENFGDCAAVGRNNLFFSGEFAERCRDTNGCGHNLVCDGS